MENKRTETNKTVQKRLEPELKLINMDTVEVEQIEWLLYPFIPYGKVTIIQGDPGEGKTTMVLQIIAKLTRGETILPADSTKDKRIDIDSESDMVDAENIENNASTQQLEAPVNVIYQTAEDGLGDTIKPRLLAAGADCTKVMVIDDSEQPLTMADVRLEEAIVQTKARMVVLDPIQGFLGSEVDMHRATLQKVREVGGDKFSYASDYEIVTKLKAFSDKYGICFLVVHHTRKMESSDSFDMISGTNGLLGAADGAFVMQKEKRTDNKAVLEVAGRDQQDQKLWLNFNRERCVWELTKTETELWKEPEDPVLEKIKELVTETTPEWAGTATELVEVLQVEMQPNALSRKLNVSLERLILEYGIQYKTERGHDGRKIRLAFVGKQA